MQLTATLFALATLALTALAQKSPPLDFHVNGDKCDWGKGGCCRVAQGSGMYQGMQEQLVKCDQLAKKNPNIEWACYEFDTGRHQKRDFEVVAGGREASTGDVTAQLAKRKKEKNPHHCQCKNIGWEGGLNDWEQYKRSWGDKNDCRVFERADGSFDAVKPSGNMQYGPPGSQGGGNGVSPVMLDGRPVGWRNPDLPDGGLVLPQEAFDRAEKLVGPDGKITYVMTGNDDLWNTGQQ